jgi:surfeit locus 1 family protein
LVLALLSLLLFAALTALGVWQLERRVWKLNLIAQIAERTQAAPIEPPPRELWSRAGGGPFTYRRIRLTGRYLRKNSTLVHAVTRLGGGYWLLTPLRTDAGFVVLVNRGFVPIDWRAPIDGQELRAPGVAPNAAPDIAPTDLVEVRGLLRLSEPKGGFLHPNDAAANRWYSRDVQAIAAARGIDQVAPYFIDADANQASPEPPIGGLTVLDLPNNHLLYALTWFTLALLLAGAMIHIARQEWRAHRA